MLVLVALTKLLQEVGCCAADIIRREIEFMRNVSCSGYQLRVPIFKAVGRH